jgi:hypothetical protein
MRAKRRQNGAPAIFVIDRVGAFNAAVEHSLPRSIVFIRRISFGVTVSAPLHFDGG